MPTIAQARQAIEVLEERGDTAGAASIRAALEERGLSVNPEADYEAEQQQFEARRVAAREADFTARQDYAESQRGSVSRGLDIGTDMISQATGSSLEGLGSIFGLQGLEEYGAEVALENEADIQRKSRFQTTFDDIGDVGDFGSYLGGIAASSAPQMATGIAGGIAGAKVGAGIGTAFGPVGTAAGTLIGGVGGAALANLPFFYGMNRERQKEAIELGLKTEVDEGAAAIAGLGQSAIDGIADRLLVGGLRITDEVIRGGGLLTRGVKGFGAGTVSEVPTEIGQQLIERAQAGLPLDDEEAMAEYREAGIAGGLLGGSIRSTSAVLGGDSVKQAEALEAEKQALEAEKQARIAALPRIPEDAVAGTQGEMFPTGPKLGIEGPEYEVNVPALRDRLFGGLDTDTFEGVENLPDEQQLEFADRLNSLSRAEKEAIDNFDFIKEAAEVPLSQDVLPGMTRPITDEGNKAYDTKLAAVSEEQLADAAAPAGTQLELAGIPRTDRTNDLLEDTLDVEEVRERVFKGFSKTARSKPISSLTAKQQQMVAKRAQKLAPAELAALEKVLAEEAATQPTTAPDQLTIDDQIDTVETTEIEAMIAEDVDAAETAEIEAMVAEDDVESYLTTVVAATDDIAETAKIEEMVVADDAARTEQANLLSASERETATGQQVGEELSIAETRRRKILADVVEQQPTRQESTLTQRFSRALEAEGFTNTQPNEAETAAIARVINITRAKRPEPVRGETLPSDSDVTAMEAVIPERQEAAIEPVQESLPGLGRKSKAGLPELGTTPEPTPEPRIVTAEDLTTAGFPPNAAIRKRVIGKDLSDPATQQDLTNTANELKSQKIKVGVTRLLEGVPSEQGDLFTTTQRKPVTAGNTTSNATDIPSTDNRAVGKDPVATGASDTGAVGNVGRGTGGVDVGTRTESAPLVNAPPVVESSSQLVLRPDGTSPTPAVDQDALIQELRTLALTPDSERTPEQRARIVELGKEPEPSTQARTATKSQDSGEIRAAEDAANVGIDELAAADTVDAGIDELAAADAIRNEVFEGFENKRVSQLSTQEQDLVTLRTNNLTDADRAILEKTLRLESGDFTNRTPSRKLGEGEGIKQKNDEYKAARVEEIRNESKDDDGNFTIGLKEANETYAQEEAAAKVENSTFVVGTYGTEVPTFGIFGSSNVTEAIDTPLEASVIDAINAGDVAGALRALSNTIPDKRARRVAKKLLEYVGTAKVFIVDPSNNNPANMTAIEARNLSKFFAKERNGQLPAGLYNSADNVIFLNKDSGVNAYTFLHEMTHAATLRYIIENPQSKMAKDLMRLYKASDSLLSKSYGEISYRPDPALSDAVNAQRKDTLGLAEFVAEAFSNPEFQRDLAKINVKGGPLSSWQKFKEAIAKFFGFDKLGGTAQAEANRLIDNILAPSRASRGLPNVPTYSTQEGVREVARSISEVKSSLTTKEGHAKIKRDFLAVFNTEMNPLLRRVLRKLLGVLPNSAVFNDIATSLNIPTAEALAAAIQELRAGLNFSEENTKKILDPIVRWSTKASKATMDAFNNLVYSSTIDEVDPELTLDEATKKYGTQLVDGTKQLKIDRYKELRAMYESNTLGAEGRKAYSELRKLYAGINEQLNNSLQGRIRGLNVDEGVKTSLRNGLLARMLEAGNIEPYFPLTRKGKYWLMVKNPADGEVAAVTYTSMGDRGEAKSKFEGMGYTVEVIDPDNLKSYLGDKADAPSGSFVAQVLGVLNDPKIPQATREQIAKLYIEALPESSFTKSLLRRKKTAGYDMDAVEAARSKAYDLARQAARIAGSNKIEAIRTELVEVSSEREEIITIETDEDGNETEVKKRGAFIRKDLQNDRAKAVIAEMVDRADFAVNPPADGFAKNVNRMAFMWTIGFNASSALVNLSQIPLFAYPMLAGKYGYTETFSAITNAGKLFTGSFVPHAKKDLFGNAETRDKFRDKYTTPSLDNYYTSTLDKDTGETLYSVREDLDLSPARKIELERIKPLIELAAARGELNTSFLAETLSVDSSGRATNYADKITNWSALMFHNAEVMNRQTTMVAAYELALGSLNLPKGQEPTREQKKQAAEEALRETQQINGGATLETGPRYARSSLGRIALMYKGFGIQMYYTMLKTGYEMVKSTYKGDKAAASQAFKQLAGVHLSAVFFAGVQGIPLYGAVSMIYDMLQEDYEENADEALRSYLDNDTLYKGLVSEMTGLDVSQRVKLTDLLFEADKFNSDPSPEETFMHFFGGPAWSVASRAYEGLGEIQNGELERGIEAMMPGAVRNGYKALYRYPRDEGILTRRGDPIYDDITSGDLFTQLLGFPPVGYTREIEETSAAKGMESAARERRSAILKRYYIATRFGDFAAADEAMDDMDAFNDAEIVYIDPKLRITRDTIDRSMRRHMSTTTKMHNGVLLSPYMKSAVDDAGFL